MWEVTLSDGNVIEQEADFSLWRRTVGLCRERGLHLTSFKWNGEEVDPRGVHCFVIHDVVGSTSRGIVRARVGMGTFRSNGKGRIHWKTQVGDPAYGDYVEVVKPEKAATYMEVAVERKLDEETAE